MITWFWLAVGLAVLTGGAELLVRGAVGLASALRVSPLVIGLTVVAFGTSAGAGRQPGVDLLRPR